MNDLNELRSLFDYCYDNHLDVVHGTIDLDTGRAVVYKMSDRTQLNLYLDEDGNWFSATKGKQWIKF